MALYWSNLYRYYFSSWIDWLEKSPEKNSLLSKKRGANDPLFFYNSLFIVRLVLFWVLYITFSPGSFINTTQPIPLLEVGTLKLQEYRSLITTRE